MEAESTPVVPASKLLEVAGVLSDGAARLHEQLGALPPAERRALLEVVVGQVGDIVQAWSQLVRAVVTTEPSPPPPSPPSAPPTPPGLRSVGANRQDLPRPASTPAVGESQAPASAAPPGGVPRPVAVPSHTASAGNGDDRPLAHPGPRPMAEAPAEVLTRDELTGVLNRNAGFVALKREVERCRRDAERFVLGYLNVDGLQQVNDSQGSRAGDDLLRKVAAALRATLRSYDVVFRLAGDEFLFSMPGADTNTAAQRVQDFTVILGQEAPGASVSVGFAELRDGDSLEELVARADDDLVEARRRRGRPRLR